MILRRAVPNSIKIALGLALAACGSAATTDDISNLHDADAAVTSEASSSSADVDVDVAVEARPAPVDGGTCVDCFVLYDLHWGMDGGNAPYVDTSRLAPCHSYTRQRSGSGRVDAGAAMCMAQVAGCPAGTITDIDDLMGDPDVTRSLQAHLLYGGDPRPVDGQVFRFGVGNDYVDVGSPCGVGAAGCVDAPASVAQLVELLREIDRVELAAEPCKSVFGAQ